MKKIVMFVALIAAMATYTTVSAQDVKKEKTEQCSKKEGCCATKKADKKAEKKCDKKAGEGCCKTKAEKK
ncbi:MAG: hypothetical protein ACRC8J_07650 [Phocaeicola sp.]